MITPAGQRRPLPTSHGTPGDPRTADRPGAPKTFLGVVRAGPPEATGGPAHHPQQQSGGQCREH